MALPDRIVLTDPDTTVLVRQRRNARRLTLRVSALDGQVTLTCPLGTGLRMAEGFLHDHRDWLSVRVAARPKAVQVCDGGQIPVEGVPFQIVQEAAVLKPYVERGTLYLPKGDAGILAEKFIKLHAMRRLTASVDGYAKRLARPYGALALRDTRSRWGSCTSEGRLMFSWRLAMAPPQVLDYVAAHEVGHLVEMNHSAAFWSVVEGICPDYATHREWLRKHGADLHRYRFG